MKCPFCGGGSWPVQGSAHEIAGALRRRRICADCRRGFRTSEFVTSYRDDTPAGWLVVTPEGLAMRLEDAEISEYLEAMVVAKARDE